MENLGTSRILPSVDWPASSFDHGRFLSQSLAKLPPWWEPIDFVTMALVLWVSVWYTDCWGRWTKPDPLIFEQVRDRSEFENRPKKSRNIVTLLKVGAGRCLLFLGETGTHC
jgi:hypothetical protein